MFKLFKEKVPKSAGSAERTAKLEQARLLSQRGRLSEAAAICAELLKLWTDDVDALTLSAQIAMLEGNPERAAPLYSQLTRLRPADSFCHYMQGNALFGIGNFEDALSSYDRAVSLDPMNIYALCNRGVILEKLNLCDEALASYDRALALDPNNAPTLCNRGAVFLRLGRGQEALASFEMAITADPKHVDSHFLRANVLKDQQRWDEAIASYQDAISVNPRFAAAYGYRGALMYERKNWDAALADYDRAIELDCNYAEAYYNRGVLLQARKKVDAAMADYEKAIALIPDYAEAHLNLGALLFAKKQFREAIACFDRAIELDPDYSQAHLNRGLLLMEVRRLDAALASLDRAIALAPDCVEAHHKRGWALFEMKRCTESIAAFDRVLAIEPNYTSVFGMRTYVKRTICDWGDFRAEIEELKAGIRKGVPLSAPMPILAFIDEAALHHRAAQIWTRALAVAVETPKPATLPASQKIRVGYFSADLREHAVATVMAGVFENHDRSKFEVTAFSLGPDMQDDMRQRLKRTFDRFVDVSEMTDYAVALLAREIGIDIAVDLGGHTAGSRPQIFAARAAPIQINYLGYPGSMGAEYIDYLIADFTVIPEDQQHNYTEKIVYLPNSYLPHDCSRAISERAFTREQLGLPPQGFVFCCFNNSYKITPVVFDGWMRILARVPGSVLWLSQSDPIAIANLRREAIGRGVDERRLVFAGRMASAAEHLARLRFGGLFLDTRPYNAHASAIDALWAGVPLLTLIGEGFAGRVAASFLRTIDLPELIASTPAEYESLAVELATDEERLSQIKRKLIDARLTTPLFDTRGFTRHLESAFGLMNERYRAGLPPDHIRVGPVAR